MPHHHGDFSTQVLFVEREGLFAITTVVQICVELHRSLLSYSRLSHPSLREKSPHQRSRLARNAWNAPVVRTCSGVAAFINDEDSCTWTIQRSAHLTYPLDLA